MARFSGVSILSFDLDDTLWDNSGIIEKAEAESFDYLADAHPPLGERFSPDDFHQFSSTLKHSGDPAYENMTVLRKAVLRQMLAETHGDPALVSPAFAVFYHWRNQVRVPEASRDLLARLAASHRLVAVTNGNSNLHLLGVARFFDKHYLGGHQGRAKPSPELLHQVGRDFAVAPQQILHIGDSLEADVAAAHNAGCLSCWFNPRQEPLPADAVTPDLTLATLEKLPEYL